MGPTVDANGRSLAAPAAAGDVAVLWGDPRADDADPATPTADEWAEACGTINYEIVTRLGPRVPRVPTGAPARRPSRTAPRKDPA